MRAETANLIKQGYLDQWLEHPFTRALLDELSNFDRPERLIYERDTDTLRMLQGNLQVLEHIRKIINTKSSDLRDNE